MKTTVRLTSENRLLSLNQNWKLTWQHCTLDSSQNTSVQFETLLTSQFYLDFHLLKYLEYMTFERWLRATLP